MRKIFLFLMLSLIFVVSADSQNMPDNVDTIADCLGTPQPTNFTIREAFRSNQVVNNYTSPVVGDIDGDGKAEIFCVVPKTGSQGENYQLFNKIAVFRGHDRQNPRLINTVEGRNVNIGGIALGKIRIGGIYRHLIFMIGMSNNKIYAYDAQNGSLV